MKEFKILKFLDKLGFIFEKLGADYKAMRKILQVKLLMDGRRVPTVFGNNKKNNDKKDDNKFIKSLWIYALMGLMLLPFIIMKSNYIYQMSIVFGMIMFLVMTSLISDFSSVFLDVRDKNLIGTKPVGAKTLSLAKTIHVSIYMFYITIALVGPALLVSLYTQGIIFFLLFLVSVIFLDIFIIVLTALLYFSILKFFDGEKLKDIINYFQIILSVGVMVGYQLIGRLFEIVDFKIEFVPKWWQYFIIPIWFSAPFQMFKKYEINNYYITFTVMAIVVPIVAISTYIKLMPVFEKNLQKLNNNSESNKKSKRKPIEFLSKVVCRNKEEKIFFKFASDMIKNEREFKLKVYPMLGCSIAFPFIFIFQQMRDMNIHEISQGRSYIFIYLCALMMPNVILMMKYSGKYKGAWIYKVLPIKNMKPIFKGTIKALTVKLFCPIYFVVGMIFILIYGVRIVPDILLVFSNTLIFIIISFICTKKALPFSEALVAAQQDEAIKIVLLMFSVPPIMGGIHFALSFISFGVYMFLVASIIINLVLWKYAFNISMDKIQ